MKRLLTRLRLKYFLVTLPLIILFSLIFLVLQTSGVKLNTFLIIRALNQFENVYLDMKTRLKPITLPTSPTVIVAFDERTLEDIGQWPPHRSRMAGLLQNILEDDPKVVGLDIVFSEEERQFFVLSQIEQKIKNSPLPPQTQTQIKDFFDQYANTLSGDLSLAKVFQKYSDKLVLGYHWYGKDIESQLNAQHIARSIEAMAFSQVNRVKGLDYPGLRYPLWPVYIQLNQNIPQLTENAEHFGFFNAVSDTDGIYRRSMLIATFKNPDNTFTFFPSLSLQMAKVAHPENPDIELEVIDLGGGIYGIDTLTSTHTKHRLLRDGTQFLNFRGPSRTFPHVSARELMLEESNLHINQINPHTGKIEPSQVPRKQFFKDKVVLIGITASGVHDLRPTPTDRLYAGVELHATTYDNLANNSFLNRRPDLGLRLTVAWSIIFSLFTFILLHLPALWGALFSLISIGLLILGDYHFFFLSKNLMLVMALPLSMMGALYGFINVLLYFVEGKEKKFIRSAFQKYVDTSVVEEIVRDPKKLALGGEKKEVSLLFSDIRGFTSLSEKIETGKLAQFLSDYFTPMTEVILAHKGTLDKYIGDAIMAFWGAPVSSSTHPQDALQAALDMLIRMKELNQTWKSKNIYPEIKMGIGINTGIVSVGNLGSKTVFNYTAVGDSVNLANRLEGLNKIYGSELLISEFTANRCDLSAVISRRVDKVAVKGKQQGVVIHQILGRVDSIPKTQIGTLTQAMELYETALQAYFSRAWKSAQQQFEKTLQLYPHDIASRVLLERVQLYAAQPGLLPENWDGTFLATTK